MAVAIFNAFPDNFNRISDRCRLPLSQRPGPLRGKVSSGINSSLTEEIENGNAEDVPTIRTITASASGDDLFWWPTQLVFDTNKAVRRDGAPQQFTSNGTTVAGMMPGVSDAQAEEPPQEGPRLAVAQMDQAPASGKGDMLVVNREGKGSLLNPPTQTLGQVDTVQ